MRIPQLTFGKLLGGTALLLVVTTGTAYAVDTVGSADIINNSIKSEDVKDGALGSVDLLDGNVKSADLKDGGVKSIDLENESILTGDILNNQIRSEDIRDDDVASIDVLNESLTSADLATDSVNATEVANNSIDSGEIVDFGLTNQDIGVLFAQVNAAGGVDNSSGGVSVIKLGTGTYEVDFGLDITSCAFVATVGPSGAGTAQGEVNMADRAGNANAVFVDTNNSDGTAADKPFTLTVVC